MSFEQVRAKAIALAEELESLAGSLSPWKTGAPEFPIDHDIGVLSHRASSLRAAEYRVLFCGEFKRGKSTVLNAMVGESVLPAKVTPCTAILTRLKRGAVPKVTVSFNDGALPRTMTISEFKKEYELRTEDHQAAGAAGAEIGRFDRVREAVIEHPSPVLPPAIELVDSPGMRENVVRTARTLEALDSAAAVVMVLSAVQNFTTDERGFIQQELLPRRLRNIFFLVNWYNAVEHEDKPKEEIERDKAELEQRLNQLVVPLCVVDGRDLSTCRIFRVNALGALRGRQSPLDPAKVARSGMPEFEAELQSFIVGDIARAGNEAAVGLAEQCEERFRAFVEEQAKFDRQPLEDLERQRQAIEPKLEWLRNIREHVRRFLLDKSEVLHVRLTSSLRQFVIEMQERIVNDISEGREIDLSLINDRLVTLNLVKDLGKTVANWFGAGATLYKDELAATIERELSAYLERRIGEWQSTTAKSVFGTIEGDIQKELAAQAEQYSRLVAEIQEQLGLTVEKPDPRKLIEQWVTDLGGPAALGRTGGLSDIGGVIASAIGPIVGSVLAESLLHLKTALVPVIGLVVASVLMVWRESRLKEKLRKGVADAANKAFATVEAKIDAAAKLKLDSGFKGLIERITSTMDAEIAGVSASLDAVIASKMQHEESSAARFEKFNSAIMQISEVVYRMKALAR